MQKGSAPKTSGTALSSLPPHTAAAAAGPVAVASRLAAGSAEAELRRKSAEPQTQISPIRRIGLIGLIYADGEGIISSGRNLGTWRRFG